MLCQKGAGHSIRQRNGDRPAHCAMKRGHWRLVERLFRAGAGLQDTGAKGRTLLHIAAMNGSVTSVEALTKLHACVDAVDDDGCTPRDLAAQKQRFNVLALLPSDLELGVRQGSVIKPQLYSKV